MRKGEAAGGPPAAAVVLGASRDRPGEGRRGLPKSKFHCGDSRISDTDFHEWEPEIFFAFPSNFLLYLLALELSPDELKRQDQRLH